MRFIILGGGCYGSFYVQQLLRARKARALQFDEVIIVDHNAVPPAHQHVREEAGIRLLQGDWDAFFDSFLREARPDSPDLFVPSPFNPHLPLGWLMRSLTSSYPQRQFTLESFSELPGTPFQQQRAQGTLVASHADWVCPVHCVEPEICPKTRDTRHWDMDRTAREYARALSGKGQPVDQVVLFHCHHVSFGVGGYPVAELAVARNQLAAELERPGARMRALVGTISRCHGAFHLLATQSGIDTVSYLDPGAGA